MGSHPLCSPPRPPRGRPPRPTGIRGGAPGEGERRLRVLDQHVHHTLPAHRGDGIGQCTLGVAHDGGGVPHRHGLAELVTQGGLVTGGREAQARHHLEHGDVPHAVAGGAVVPGDAGAVKHEGDPRAVQADVHEDLVERTVQEGGVDREHGVRPGEGHPRGGGHGVLLGDAHVDDTVRELPGHRPQAHGQRHGGRQCDDVLTFPRDADDLVGEHAGPPEACRGDREPRLGVDSTHRVEAVRDVLLRRCVAAPLLGDHVDDDGVVQ